jgi:hypothetical protein
MTQYFQSSRSGLLLCLVLLLAPACGGNKAGAKNGGDVARGKALAGATDGTTASDARHEVSEYDTSGDETLDVRKVFLRVGDGTLARLVLVCRESDLNSDGVKDIVRYYTDEGRPTREEADRDFDGQMDEITYFQNGQIMRQEFDSKGNGRVDGKVFFEDGKPLRAERDLKGRSTTEKWQPDRWEYFEGGRMVRMGTDLDGDGKVDRWDRDMILRRSPDADSGAADASG